MWKTNKCLLSTVNVKNWNKPTPPQYHMNRMLTENKYANTFNFITCIHVKNWGLFHSRLTSATLQRWILSRSLNMFSVCFDVGNSTTKAGTALTGLPLVTGLTILQNNICKVLHISIHNVSSSSDVGSKTRFQTAHCKPESQTLSRERQDC